MSARLQQVHVRVNEKGTNNAVPVRIRFATPEGKEFAPFGRVLEFGTFVTEDVGGQYLRWDQTRHFHIDGGCEIGLPPGPLEIQVARGPEYLPLRQTVNVLPGKLALRLEIERWIDLKQQGWYSGDSHCFFLPPHSALLEGAAEDLAVVNLLARVFQLEHFAAPGSYPVVNNILAFSGQQPAVQRPGHLVVVNTFNQHPGFGALILLNCHRPVYPLQFGPHGSDPGAPDDWTLADWCGQCHRKKGLVIAYDFISRNGSPAEHLADILLGEVDALEAGSIWSVPDTLLEWYQLLNAGLRLPLVAGSAKDSNRNVLGGQRTYARLRPGEEFSYRAWIEAIRAGRTFATLGPLFTFAEHAPGDVIDVPNAGDTVLVKFTVAGAAPVGWVEVLYNSSIIAQLPGPVDNRSKEYEIPVTVREPGWLALSCAAPPGSHPAMRLGAHTSPIYFTVAGQARRCPVDLAEQLDQRLEAALDWVGKIGQFENDQQKQRMASVYLRAQERLKSMV